MAERMCGGGVQRVSTTGVSTFSGLAGRRLRQSAAEASAVQVPLYVVTAAADAVAVQAALIAAVSDPSFAQQLKSAGAWSHALAGQQTFVWRSSEVSG